MDRFGLTVTVAFALSYHTTMSNPETPWKIAVQFAIPEAVTAVTDTDTMTNKLNIADFILLLQACIPFTTPLHPLVAPC
jgi:hypothetical protein